MAVQTYLIADTGIFRCTAATMFAVAFGVDALAVTQGVAVAAAHKA